MPGSRSSTDPEHKSPRESGEDSEDESEILEESPCGRWLKRREEVYVCLNSFNYALSRFLLSFARFPADNTHSAEALLHVGLVTVFHLEHMLSAPSQGLKNVVKTS